MVIADPTASDQAGSVRSSRCAGKRSDRLHSRAERAGSRNLQDLRNGPLFTPPSVRTDSVLGTLQLPGNQGSALWQGAAWDPETNMLYVPSVSNMTVQALQPGGTRSDMTYIGGAGGGGEAPQGGRAGGPAANEPAGRAAGPAPQAGPTSAGPGGAGGSQGTQPAAGVPAGGGRGDGGRGGAAAAPGGFFPTPQFGRGAVPTLGPGVGVVPGAWARRVFRSSSRHTGASRPTT